MAQLIGTYDARVDLLYVMSARNGRLGVLPRSLGGAWACIDGVGRYHDWDIDSAINHVEALAWWLDQEDAA